MSKKNIVSVGFTLPGEDVDELSLKSKASLLDYDVIIISPEIHEFYGYSYDEYLGKRCLNDSNSFSLKEHIEHWRREILESIRAGKNVFLMLNSKEDLYVATGEVTYSGTGRNRQPTRMVSPISNYKIIPGNIEFTNSSGSAMKLSDKAEIIAPYWSAVGNISEYRILLTGGELKPIIETKTGSKAVGAIVRYKNSEGNLFLLPYIDFNVEKNYFKKDGLNYWTDDASASGKRFISSICSLDKALRTNGELSAIPDWVTQNKYILPKEEEARQKLVKVESEIEGLQRGKEELEQRLFDESALKGLLYEKGKPLEITTRTALELMGFDVSIFQDSESEFDVVFESKEGRLIGEVEGKDNKAINIDKLRQLEMNILEDFERDEVDKMAKGALIGNAYRLIEPSERGDFFTDKCLTAAARSGTALIRSVDLFETAKYLSNIEDTAYSDECRKAILNTVGLVSFPRLPFNEENIKTLIKSETE